MDIARFCNAECVEPFRRALPSAILSGKRSTGIRETRATVARRYRIEPEPGLVEAP